MSQSPSVVRNPKKRKFKNDDVYVEAIESIAQSLKMPVTPVNITTENIEKKLASTFFWKTVILWI